MRSCRYLTLHRTTAKLSTDCAVVICRTSPDFTLCPLFLKRISANSGKGLTPHVALLAGDASPSVITVLYDFITMAYKGLQNPKSAFSMFRIWGRLIILGWFDSNMAQSGRTIQNSCCQALVCLDPHACTAPLLRNLASRHTEDR